MIRWKWQTSIKRSLCYEEVKIALSEPGFFSRKAGFVDSHSQESHLGRSAINTQNSIDRWLNKYVKSARELEGVRHLIWAGKKPLLHPSCPGRPKRSWELFIVAIDICKVPGGPGKPQQLGLFGFMGTFLSSIIIYLFKNTNLCKMARRAWNNAKSNAGMKF